MVCGPRWSKRGEGPGLGGIAAWAMRGQKRFSRDRRGAFRPRLLQGAQELLGRITSECISAVEAGTVTTKRVFPVAYPDDEGAQAEYEEMTGAALLEGRLADLKVLVGTVENEDLSEAEMGNWLRALEVLRLVLGTQLDVGEGDIELDSGDFVPREMLVYQYLSGLQSEVIDALADLLPEVEEEPDIDPDAGFGWGFNASPGGD